MHDELTAVDIKKMEQEVEYRRLQLRPQLLEDVKTAREFGDLSENFEYKAAKREKSRNDSRIRYLERMIKTAKVIDASSNPDEIGLFDKVTIYIEEDDEEQEIELVTTVINELDAVEKFFVQADVVTVLRKHGLYSLGDFHHFVVAFGAQ